MPKECDHNFSIPIKDSNKFYCEKCYMIEPKFNLKNVGV